MPSTRLRAPLDAKDRIKIGDAVHVGQGEVFVTRDAQEQVGTVLGSCVATVLWDNDQQVGGVNHLLLPPTEDLHAAAIGVHVNLMERLINGVLNVGGTRGHLRAKVFGGASMISGLSNAGLRNSQFVTTFLADEAIPCDVMSMGGTMARRLKVWPATGRVLQRLLKAQDAHALTTEELHLAAPQVPGEAVSHNQRALLKLSGVELL